jgi:hypothetical protein
MSTHVLLLAGLISETTYKFGKKVDMGFFRLKVMGQVNLYPYRLTMGGVM